MPAWHPCPVAGTLLAATLVQAFAAAGVAAFAAAGADAFAACSMAAKAVSLPMHSCSLTISRMRPPWAA